MESKEEDREASNWKLTIAYDGTDFFGWQVQPDRATVQGELAAAIERIAGERVLPQGSGRTDAGVHARRQVASFALRAPIPASNLQRALNRTLPEAIRVLSAERAAADFHARHSARAKTYEYRIYRGELCPPWEARYAWAMNTPAAHERAGGSGRRSLDIDLMEQAAQCVVGPHDFTSFAATAPDAATRMENEEDQGATSGKAGNVRTIFSSEWRQEGVVLAYRVRGNGFLHHMVRNLVGTFVDAGRGQIAPEDVGEILKARSRSAAGATAPARGLFLESVEY